MYLRQCISCYVGEHVIDIQFIHHYPDSDCHNQGIQRTDYHKAENSRGLFHSLLFYTFIL